MFGPFDSRHGFFMYYFNSIDKKGSSKKGVCLFLNYRYQALGEELRKVSAILRYCSWVNPQAHSEG